MRLLLTSLLFVSSISSATSLGRDAQQLRKAVRAITIETVLVRSGLAKCKVPEAKVSMAGSLLESDYASAFAATPAKELTAKNWRALTQKDCRTDCSCFALSELAKKYPTAQRKKISTNAIEKHLATLTDADYKKCELKHSDFCAQKEVVDFIKRLNDSP